MITQVLKAAGAIFLLSLVVLYWLRLDSVFRALELADETQVIPGRWAMLEDLKSNRYIQALICLIAIPALRPSCL